MWPRSDVRHGGRSAGSGRRFWRHACHGAFGLLVFFGTCTLENPNAAGPRKHQEEEPPPRSSLPIPHAKQCERPLSSNLAPQRQRPARHAIRHQSRPTRAKPVTFSSVFSLVHFLFPSLRLTLDRGFPFFDSHTTRLTSSTQSQNTDSETSWDCRFWHISDENALPKNAWCLQASASL